MYSCESATLLNLIRSLNDIHYVVSLKSVELDGWLQLAKQSGLLATLGYRLQDAGLLSTLPEKARRTILGTMHFSGYLSQMAQWEINRLQRTLKDVSDIVLLKGAAYITQQIPGLRGRYLSDVDILVPEEQLNYVEQCLLKAGWESHKPPSGYDDYYYRQWMHEIPPLRHRFRSVDVDLHHRILPRTSRLNPDPDLLLATAQSCTISGVKVLSAEDQFLHSCVHLFYDSELKNRLRDLVDLDVLYRYFTEKYAGFDQKLLARANELGVQRPFYYSLIHTRSILKTPIPDDLLQSIQQFKPNVLVNCLMNKWLPLALLPVDSGPRLHKMNRLLAIWGLYIRSHWLRMPPFLLTKHLFIKAWMRLGGKV
ncbi:nucleotidyltransferase domain-containing protein [Zooshikella harenae]|uniref:Nucleotidyltransferase family protein n=1 Tax=Zooshikella harenae TaxID=2827238 RepID=A0ABS5ZEX0_9GAMM|nr:nucleotidyltransferase family protein [Zooshikella harenae]MBU2711841.1 nucleotidyltransferase family protein [Zooshikella harenae]